jgi:hypothetical protein
VPLCLYPLPRDYFQKVFEPWEQWSSHPECKAIAGWTWVFHIDFFQGTGAYHLLAHKVQSGLVLSEHSIVCKVKGPYLTQQKPMIVETEHIIVMRYLWPMLTWSAYFLTFSILRSVLSIGFFFLSLKYDSSLWTPTITCKKVNKGRFQVLCIYIEGNAQNVSEGRFHIQV